MHRIKDPLIKSIADIAVEALDYCEPLVGKTEIHEGDMDVIHMYFTDVLFAALESQGIKSQPVSAEQLVQWEKQAGVWEPNVFCFSTKKPLEDGK